MAVNAPEAGTIKEFLANEEDTVTVGQDLVRMELGGSASSGDEKASSEPKEPASKDQPTSSDPEPKKEESKEEPKKEESKPEPTQEKKPEPKKESPPPKQEPKKTETKSSSSQPSLGNREERRVRHNFPSSRIVTNASNRSR